MRSFNFVVLPSIDVLHGLIYGHYHDLRNTPLAPENKSCRLFYIDVTQDAAEASLYKALKREYPKGMIASGYQADMRNFRGMTSPKHVAIVLSPNLSHVDPRPLMKYLFDIFNSLSRTGRVNGTLFNIYVLAESAQLIPLIRRHELDIYDQELIADNDEQGTINALDVSLFHGRKDDEDLGPDSTIRYPESAVFGDDLLVFDASLVSRFFLHLRKAGVKVKLSPAVYDKLVTRVYSEFN